MSYLPTLKVLKHFTVLNIVVKFWPFSIQLLQHPTYKSQSSSTCSLEDIWRVWVWLRGTPNKRKQRGEGWLKELKWRSSLLMYLLYCFVFRYKFKVGFFVYLRNVTVTFHDLGTKALFFTGANASNSVYCFICLL